MSREFDPNNLSVGDVARVLGPLVGVIIAVVAVGKYAPQYLWVLFAALFVLVMYSVRSMPKESLEAMEDQRQRTHDKIKNLPYLGPVIYPLWRVFSWLNGLIGIAMLLLMIYLLYRGAS
jgi:carbon starvation protein CstA